jgi:hypothetical protein
MPINILSLITQSLTPDMIAKIASALGLDRLVAQDAIGASIPALLASLAGVASQPGGAKQLSNVLAQQKPSALDNATAAIGSSGQKALADSGTSMLSALLGGGSTSALASTIARACGIGEGASKSLIGTLGPIVLGALSQQQRAAGMDAGAMASLLASQKDQIAAAMPSGLLHQLGSAGLLETAGGSVRSAAAATAAAAGSMGDTADRLTARASEAAHAAQRSMPAQWPYWALGLAVLAGLGWYLLTPSDGTKVAEAPPPPVTKAAQEPGGGTVGLAVPDLTVGGVDLAKQVSESVNGLKIALGDITDAASAQAALPKIRDAKAQLDKISLLSDRLPPAGKQALAKLVAAAMPTVNDLFDKVLAMPGVGPVATPTIDELRVRLKSLATA